MSKFAIFLALPEELDHAISVLERYGEFSGDIKEKDAGQFRFRYNLSSHAQTENRGTVCLINGMGNSRSAAFVGNELSSGPLNGPRPEIAILVGISGSLDPSTADLTDVVISSHVKHYHPDKLFDLPDGAERLHARATTSAEPHFERTKGGATRIDCRDIIWDDCGIRYKRDCIYDAETAFKIGEFIEYIPQSKINISDTNGSKSKVVSGAILGTNCVVDSRKFVDYLVDKNEDTSLDYYYLNNMDEFKERSKWNPMPLLAVDMESYGFFLSLNLLRGKRLQTAGYAVRGISDLATNKSDLDQKTKGLVRKRAVENAVTVALELIDYNLRNSSQRYS